MSLLDLDPDLGRLLQGARCQAARDELTVRAARLPHGEWEIDDRSGVTPQDVGLLILDGMLAREIRLGDTVSLELLGEADVVRPWRRDTTARLLGPEVRWSVLVDARIAVLDQRFATRLARFPEVNAVLMERLNARVERLAILQAIGQLNGVDRRLLTLFWHLAERWGRRAADGVLLAIDLPHRSLGHLVGAQRSTVTTALAELVARGDLRRRPNGTWVLTGDPVGHPDAEAARIVEHRRRLLPPEVTAVEPIAPPAMPVASVLRIDALREARERALRESRLNVQRLTELRRSSAALQRRADDLRAERAAYHERLGH
jgi:CRP/FNR family transcriptional regulator, cyclic AMP receptor protein